jgi:selenide, water dikinase
VQVLHGLPKFDNADMLVGTETSDDAGVYRLRPDLAIVNTVDFFTPIVDDPYLFGQIAATNSLSDVYAMGGEPRTAMNIVCFPKGKMDIEILGQILRGGADKVKESGAVVIGGHSIIDEEIKYGMAITGVIHPDKIFRNVGVQEGDAVVLTKPLGTGIISTALKKGKASKESIDAAVQSMITLNAAASKVARKFPVHACSDVTGFGIIGHALGMASGSSVTLIIESAKLPLLHRAPRLAEKGYITGGCKRNREYLQDKITIDQTIREGIVEVAIDPQTSGGLLIAIAKRHTAKLVEELHAAGVMDATEVGYATSLQKAWVRLV